MQKVYCSRKNKVGFDESQILARRKSEGPPEGFVPIQCLNPEEHKNGDAHPSAYYNSNTGWYGCRVCGLCGYANDRDSDDYARRKKAYLYSDGTRVFRKDGKDGTKRIWQDAATKNGQKPKPYGWEWITDDTDMILVVEGEKAVDMLLPLLGDGLVAVTSRGGSGAAAQTDWSPVKERIRSGATVEFVPDRDKQGEKHIYQVAGLLDLEEMRVRRFGGDRNDGYDIADVIEAGGDLDSEHELSVERVSTSLVVRHTDVLQQSNGSSEKGLHRNGGCDLGDFLGYGTPTPVKWIVPGVLPEGKLSLLVGQPGSGKTVLALYIAASLSRGRSPFGPLESSGLFDEGLKVLIYSSEDGWNDTLFPRLQLMDCETKYVGPLWSPVRGLEFEFRWQDEEDVRKLHRRIASSGVRLLIIDPIVDIIGSRNNNDPAVIRSSVEEKIKPILNAGCAVLGVHHERKDIKKSDSLTVRVLGSQAWVAVARSVLQVQIVPKHVARNRVEIVKKDLKTNSERYGVLVVSKSNLAKIDGGWHFEMPVERIAGSEQVRIAMNPKKFQGISPERLFDRYDPGPDQKRVSAVEEKAQLSNEDQRKALERARSVILALFEEQDEYPSKKLVALVRERADVGSRNAGEAIAKMCDGRKAGKGWVRTLKAAKQAS